jgi:hypothetical protein
LLDEKDDVNRVRVRVGDFKVPTSNAAQFGLDDLLAERVKRQQFFLVGEVWKDLLQVGV